MKFLDTSYINDGIGREQPIPARSVQWWQTASKEAISTLVQAITNYTTGDMVILYGCGVHISGSAYSYDPGAIYFDGEIYIVSGNSGIIAVGQKPIWQRTVLGTLVPPFPDPTNDPLTFTDTSTASVHLTNTFYLISGPSGGSGVTNYVADYDGAAGAPIINFMTATQANWTESNAANPDYIQNKPALATVATSGSYNDLSSKPTIPSITTQKASTTVTPSAGGGPLTVLYQYENLNGAKKLVFSINGNLVSPNTSSDITCDFTAIFTTIGGGSFDLSGNNWAALDVKDTTAGKGLGGSMQCSGSTVTLRCDGGFFSTDTYFVSGGMPALMS